MIFRAVWCVGNTCRWPATACRFASSNCGSPTWRAVEHLNSAHGARVCAALPWRMPNFVLLHTGRPEIAHLLTAMLQAREAVGRRSWSHPQEPTGEDWWADSWLTHEPENEIGAPTRP
jgi:hypothetical protein